MATCTHTHTHTRGQVGCQAGRSIRAGTGLGGVRLAGWSTETSAGTEWDWPRQDSIGLRQMDTASQNERSRVRGPTRTVPGTRYPALAAGRFSLQFSFAYRSFFTWSFGLCLCLCLCLRLTSLCRSLCLSVGRSLRFRLSSHRSTPLSALSAGIAAASSAAAATSAATALLNKESWSNSAQLLVQFGFVPGRDQKCPREVFSSLEIER